jgi:hypothetical protein
MALTSGTRLGPYEIVAPRGSTAIEVCARRASASGQCSLTNYWHFHWADPEPVSHNRGGPHAKFAVSPEPRAEVGE